MDNLAVSFQKAAGDYSPEAWRSLGRDSGKSFNDYYAEGWQLVGILPENLEIDLETRRCSATICTAFFQRPRR